MTSNQEYQDLLSSQDTIATKITKDFSNYKKITEPYALEKIYDKIMNIADEYREDLKIFMKANKKGTNPTVDTELEYELEQQIKDINDTINTFNASDHTNMPSTVIVTIKDSITQARTSATLLWTNIKNINVHFVSSSYLQMGKRIDKAMMKIAQILHDKNREVPANRETIQVGKPHILNYQK